MPDDQCHRDNVSAARRLRRDMTYPEQFLWQALRDRRLAGWKFRRQHPVGAFVLDFFCPPAGLAIEVDGAVHGSPQQAARDETRQEALEALGIRFLRISVSALLSDPDAVLQRIVECLAAPTTLTLNPSPCAQGEGRDDGE